MFRRAPTLLLRLVQTVPPLLNNASGGGPVVLSTRLFSGAGSAGASEWASVLRHLSAQGAWHPAFGARAVSTGTAVQQQQQQHDRATSTEKGLVVEEGEFNAITDKIPQRPVTMVEGTSYTIVILAGLAFAGAILWAAVNELLIQPKEYTCFNKALEKVRDDPRVTVRVGTPITGYGQESRNRAARQRIPHRVFQGNDGREHVQVQFHVKGPSGGGLVTSEMYQDDSKQWQYVYLYLDCSTPVPQRLVLIGPQF